MHLFRSSLLAAAVTLGVCLAPGHAAPPPDNSTGEEARVTQTIKAVMRDVDDVGLVLLWNGLGAKTLASCEWQSGGIHGSGQVRIDNKLTRGDNYVVFVCFNKRYEGGFFGGGGKWSYDFSLVVDGENHWHRSDLKRENGPAMVYWKVFRMTPRSNGTVAITDEIPSAMLSAMTRYMDELESKLVSNASIARPF